MSECNHCWHYSMTQHAMMNHVCETCCHCGTGRCRTVQPVIPEGHGPHYPMGTVRVPSIWTGDEVQVPYRLTRTAGDDDSWIYMTHTTAGPAPTFTAGVRTGG